MSRNMEGLGINTSFHDRKSDLASLPRMFSSQHYSTLQHDNNDVNPTGKQDTIQSIDNPNEYEYEYYDMDNNDDANSIQASPVDIAPRPNPLSSDPSSRQTSGMTNTSMSSHTNYSVHQDNMSPVSQQNSSFSNHSGSPSNNQRYSPSTSSMNKNNLSHSSSRNNSNKPHTQNLSAVAKVRNMFPGFGSYKALNKSSSNQLDENPSSSPYSFANESALSFVGDDPAERALEANRGDPRQNKEDHLPFANKKPAPHFTEIDLGPTYKAQVIPVRNDSKDAASATSPSQNAASPNSHQLDDEHENLLHSRSKSETLDFLPNLRPAIDNVGSRLRTAGVPSPATLMMTKSQYDKYRQTAKDGEKGNKDGEEEEDEEEDEDDEYDSDDDEQTRRARRALEEDEAKKQDFRMRMKQDAHLSVYRQKMTKLTGSQIGLSNMNPSSPFQANSASPLEGFDYDSDEDYDDVPLGILKAHGFPTSGRLKTMKANVNDDLNMLQPPGLYGGQARPSGDNMSIRSAQSNGPVRPTTPAATEEGYLAMRNQSATNLPGFNSSVPMNRGLIGEIAKEEQNKIRRKGLMNDLAMQRTNTMNGSFMEPNDNGSIMNGQGGQQQSSEIQAQLQQMMQMQTQILQQMATTSAHSSPMTMMSTPGMMTPVNFATGPVKKNWSSFDVMSTHQLMPSRNGAPSIRSVAMSEHSMRSYAGPQTARYKPAHQSHNSLHSFDMMAGAQGGQQGGQQGGNGFKFPNRQPTPQQQPPQPTMRLVDVDEDDDDDDDDEAGWKEMEQRRQQLRQMWDSQPAMVS